jgi:hypothetical protein
MRTLALLLALAAAPRAEGARPAADLPAAARCVARYLDAVRIAAPSPTAVRPERVLAVVEEDWAAAKKLTAPRTLEEVAQRAARGERHDMAPWLAAGRDRFLESFQLLGARRAPLGAVVVTVRERFYVVGEGGERLDPLVSEYLAARVGGAWRVVDRRAGGRISDAEIEAGYEGFWDAP